MGFLTIIGFVFLLCVAANANSSEHRFQPNRERTEEELKDAEKENCKREMSRLEKVYMERAKELKAKGEWVG